MPGDYLYYNGAERHFLEGSWGILRVFDGPAQDLKPLPGTGMGSADVRQATAPTLHETAQ